MNAVLHDKSEKLIDYMNISLKNGEVTSSIAEIAFNARLKHLLFFYPEIISPQGTLDSISKELISSLQTDQVEVDKIFIKYDNYDSFPTIHYSYGDNKKVIMGARHLNSQIFDYITTTNAGRGLPISLFNFSFKIMETPVVGLVVTLIFATRYDALFSMLPAEVTFNDYIFNMFNNFFLADFRTSYLSFLLT